MKKSSEFLKLIRLAKFVRKKVENLAHEEKMPPNLKGYCGISSLYLQSVALKHNIKTNLIVGIFKKYIKTDDRYDFLSGHSWIDYDNHIIDITATQFYRKTASEISRNFHKKIYVCEIKSPHYEEIFKNDAAMDKITEWYDEPLSFFLQKVENSPPIHFQ